ncbi:MAG: NAD(P)/FAD-dependent oxidoreductase [Deltaproteobacteria bacterium]|nr:NAD(P)/FAD-dependent oxidoreductase [Deltaproteobacteria bacterium]
MTHYLIIGNGVAGTMAAENILKKDEDAAITITTDESMPFYWRIQLNDYIAGELGEEKLYARNKEWYNDHGIDLRLNTPVQGGDTKEKVAVTRDNRKIPYDRLLIATGSHSFVPPIKGAEKKGVFTLRSFRDASNIMDWAKNTRKVVMIGGGLLGLEAGNALRKLGKEVMVVEFFPRLLPRQLDVPGAKRLQTIMEDMGFSFRLGAKTQEILGNEGVEGVLLEGGESLPARMVIISAGVRPNLDLAKALGLDHDKGIKVDERMRTNQPDVFAAGDVAEYKGMSYGIWPAAMEQGKVAGSNMAGSESFYKGTVMANTLKVVGIDLASAGEIDVDNKFESRTLTDEKTYKKVVINDDLVVGCIMLGDTKGFTKITKMMADKRSVTTVKETLLADESSPT